jgi:hypothetical protein
VGLLFCNQYFLTKLYNYISVAKGALYPDRYATSHPKGVLYLYLYQDAMVLPKDDHSSCHYQDASLLARYARKAEAQPMGHGPERVCLVGRCIVGLDHVDISAILLDLTTVPAIYLSVVGIELP